jgi:hypothetical protein
MRKLRGREKTAKRTEISAIFNPSNNAQTTVVELLVT